MIRFRLPVHTVCDKIDEFKEIIRKPSSEIKIKKEQNQETILENS